MIDFPDSNPYPSIDAALPDRTTMPHTLSSKMSPTTQIIIGVVVLVVAIGLVTWKRSTGDGKPSGTLVFEDEDGNKIEVPEGENPLGAILAAETEKLREQGVAIAEMEPLEGTAFYIKIPEAVQPIERGEKYEEPLWDEFEKDNSGEIIGGGTMMDTDKNIEYCGIDVTVADVEKGLEIMRRVLIKQGAPEGTLLIQLEPKEIEHPLHKPKG